MAAGSRRLAELPFRRQDGVKALVLTGSLANSKVAADKWSDADLKVILADELLETYCSSPAWLAPLGEVIASDLVEVAGIRTLRVCLGSISELDLTFIPASRLASAASWDSNPFAGEYAVVWSRMADLERVISSMPPPPPFQDIASGRVPAMAEAFWFKATIVIAKVVRNDLLIALHLALDLARDCLVLQMMLRDRAAGTNVHRAGGPGNELAAELLAAAGRRSAADILEMVRVCGTIFDRLAPQLVAGYRKRAHLLEPALTKAARRAGDEDA